MTILHHSTLQQEPCEQVPARLAVNTVHMFMNSCSRSLFANTAQKLTRCEPAEGARLHTSPKGGGAFGAAPFLAYEEVFPWRVHTVLYSEEYLRTVNANNCAS